MSVQEAIDKFLKGEIELLTEPTAKKSIGHGNDEEHNHQHYHDGQHHESGRHNNDE